MEEFQKYCPRPLFIIIFRPEMLKFLPYDPLGPGTPELNLSHTVYTCTRVLIRQLPSTLIGPWVSTIDRCEWHWCGFTYLYQARLWVCGRGDTSTPSFGSNLNPISTSGADYTHPIYWCPHQVLKATGLPEVFTEFESTYNYCVRVY